jgi:predicted PurR-regulated permease PerM
LLSVGVPPGRVLWQLVRPLVAATILGLIVWGLREVLTSSGVPSPAVRLAVLVTAGVAVYLLLSLRDIRWLMMGRDWTPPG